MRHNDYYRRQSRRMILIILLISLPLQAAQSVSIAFSMMQSSSTGVPSSGCDNCSPGTDQSDCPLYSYCFTTSLIVCDIQIHLPSCPDSFVIMLNPVYFELSSGPELPPPRRLLTI